MKIVVLDGYTLNPGDLDWDGLKAFGDVKIYDRTSLTDEKEIISRIGDAEVVFTNKTPIRENTLNACPNIKFIGVLATGFDVVDVGLAKQKGIPVTNIPTYGTASVGQFAIALLLEICHHVAHHSQAVHEGRWESNPDWCFWDYPLIELDGKTMGIIGFGRIGQAVAKAAIGAGMKVIAYDLFVEKATITLDFFDGRSLDFTISTQSFDEVLKHSDIISLHVPSQSKYLISFAEFEKMKDRAVLINTARGGVVDEKALLTTLESGKLLGAALDVFEEEPTPSVFLLMNDALSLSPHLAGNTIEAQERIGLELAQQIIDFYEK